MTKEELRLIVEEEKKIYLGKNKIKMKKSRHKRYYIFMYLFYFRHCQYYRNLRNNHKKLSKIQRNVLKYKYRHYEKMKNIYSYKSGVEIGIDSIIGRRCNIWHSGVVINGIIGDDCVFHGNNIIGNKGIGKDSLRPTIGNNADVGAGAVIIGNVSIADSCKIGAGSVVTKSFNEDNSIIVGIPGKKLN